MKLGKHVLNQSPVGQQQNTRTDYLDGFQYVDEVLQFFPTAEGYVSVTNGSAMNYVYNYADHLGNSRVSYTFDREQGRPRIVEESHYYPFGLKHNYSTVVREWQGSGPVLDIADRSKYQYKYNGKEYQDELGLNFYDYGARNYDPAIGRWMNIDNLSDLYTDISPYSYTLNNPIRYIDPDGNRVDDSWIYAKHNGQQNKALIKAWETFAKSEEGIAFLSNFAEKGQVIAGHEYTESGKFDKNNHDLNFGLEKDGADAQTSTKEKKDGGMQTTILLSNTGYVVDNYINDIAHEGFAHAEKDGEDYADDKKMNLSNLDKDVVQDTDSDIKKGYWPAYRRSSAQHYQEKKDQTLNKRLLPMLKAFYKSKNIKKDEKTLNRMVNGYAH